MTKNGEQFRASIGANLAFVLRHSFVIRHSDLVIYFAPFIYGSRPDETSNHSHYFADRPAAVARAAVDRLHPELEG
jgi:hypothetical protein